MSFASSANVDADFARLLAGSYGERGVTRAPGPSRGVTLSADAGTEVMGSGQDTYQEYVVERGEPPAEVVPDAAATVVPAPAEAPQPVATPQPAPPPSAAYGAAPRGAPAAQAPPAASAGGPQAGNGAAGAGPAPLPAADPYAAATAPPPGTQTPPAARPAPPSPAVAPAASPVAAQAPGGGQQRAVSEDDLAADMQAILTGQKYWDPRSGTMVDKNEPAPTPAPAAVTASTEHAIFDRIAESMQHANAYDLGSLALTRRFAQFDEAAAARRSAAPSAIAASVPPGAVAPAVIAPIGPAEFIHDLSAMEDSRTAPFPLWSATFRGLDRGASARIGNIGRLADLSRPFFDTGEHARAAEEIGVVPLTISGVAFGYGEIVAMPDFFDTPEDLIRADAGQLGALRELIRSSAAHYRTGTGRDPVSDTQWQDATGGRYLELAAQNYAHFSPISVIQQSFAQRHTDNRARYAQLHKQALRESQQLHLAHPQASPTLESALIVNAFADHFLTDAFASGHLVNKEYVLDRFEGGFYNGGDLTPVGEAFLDRVATKAFVGDVKAKFSRLEEEKPTIGVGSFGKRLNIDTKFMFLQLLKRAATTERDKLANIAVKVLHDHLNHTGVMVTNEAGVAPWRLHGDEALDAATLGIMRQAVAQSVANLSDPSLLASGSISRRSSIASGLRPCTYACGPCPTQRRHREVHRSEVDGLQRRRGWPDHGSDR